MSTEDVVKTILKDSNYHLSLFTQNEIDNLRKRVFSKTTRGKETPFVNCIIRDKDIQLKPEEIVRQLFTVRLIKTYSYSKKRIFFAVSEKGGKDNSGNYTYLKNGNGQYKLDKNGHLIVDHDLHKHDGELPDGIAEAFIEFAKNEQLNFWKQK